MEVPSIGQVGFILFSCLLFLYGPWGTMFLGSQICASLGHFNNLQTCMVLINLGGVNLDNFQKIVRHSWREGVASRD